MMDEKRQVEAKPFKPPETRCWRNDPRTYCDCRCGAYVIAPANGMSHCAVANSGASMITSK